MNYRTHSNIGDASWLDSLAQTATTAKPYDITIYGEQQQEAVRVMSLSEKLEDLPEEVLKDALIHYLHLEIEQRLTEEDLKHELNQANSNLKTALDFARRKFEKAA